MFLSSENKLDPNTFLLYLSRVFLRAINQYAAVLNKKFLDQTNFELQVRPETMKVSATPPPLSPSPQRQCSFTQGSTGLSF